MMVTGWRKLSNWRPAHVHEDDAQQEGDAEVGVLSASVLPGELEL